MALRALLGALWWQARTAVLCSGPRTHIPWVEEPLLNTEPSKRRVLQNTVPVVPSFVKGHIKEAQTLN